MYINVDHIAKQHLNYPFCCMTFILDVFYKNSVGKFNVNIFFIETARMFFEKMDESFLVVYYSFGFLFYTNFYFDPLLNFLELYNTGVV